MLYILDESSASFEYLLLLLRDALRRRAHKAKSNTDSRLANRESFGGKARCQIEFYPNVTRAS